MKNSDSVKVKHIILMPKPILNQAIRFKGEAAECSNPHEHNLDQQNSFASFQIGNGVSYNDEETPISPESSRSLPLDCSEGYSSEVEDCFLDYSEDRASNAREVTYESEPIAFHHNSHFRSISSDENHENSDYNNDSENSRLGTISYNHENHEGRGLWSTMSISDISLTTNNNTPNSTELQNEDSLAGYFQTLRLEYPVLEDDDYTFADQIQMQAHFS